MQFQAAKHPDSVEDFTFVSSGTVTMEGDAVLTISEVGPGVFRVSGGKIGRTYPLTVTTELGGIKDVSTLRLRMYPEQLHVSVSSALAVQDLRVDWAPQLRGRTIVSADWSGDASMTVGSATISGSTTQTRFSGVGRLTAVAGLNTGEILATDILCS